MSAVTARIEILERVAVKAWLDVEEPAVSCLATPGVLLGSTSLAENFPSYIVCVVAVIYLK